MPTPVPCFQLDIEIGQSIDSAMSAVISRIHANNGTILLLESFSEDAVILYLSIHRISYGVLVSMLSRVGEVTEKPFSGTNTMARSRAQEDLTGQLVVSTRFASAIV